MRFLTKAHDESTWLIRYKCHGSQDRDLFTNDWQNKLFWQQHQASATATQSKTLQQYHLKGGKTKNPLDSSQPNNASSVQPPFPLLHTPITNINHPETETYTIFLCRWRVDSGNPQLEYQFLPQNLILAFKLLIIFFLSYRTLITSNEQHLVYGSIPLLQRALNLGSLDPWYLHLVRVIVSVFLALLHRILITPCQTRMKNLRKVICSDTANEHELWQN